MAPERALLTDKNEYIIRLYQGIQQGRITAETVRAFLLSMWQKDEVKKNRHLYQYWEDFCWHGQQVYGVIGHVPHLPFFCVLTLYHYIVITRKGQKGNKKISAVPYARLQICGRRK